MNSVSDEHSVLVVPLFKNGWLFFAIAFSVSLYCVILYIPFFANIFGLAPFDCSEWMLVINFNLAEILIDEVMKLIPRRMSSDDKRQMLIKDKAN